MNQILQQDKDLVEIKALKEKLLVAVKNLAEMTAMNEALMNENDAITNDVIKLQRVLKEKDFNHKRDITKVSLRSQRDGQASVARELDKVWTSSEFAAELMYGEPRFVQYFPFNKSHRRPRPDTQPVRLHSKNAELFLQKTVAWKAGVENQEI